MSSQPSQPAFGMTSCSECTIAPPYHVDPLKVKAMTECDGRACVIYSMIICLAMGKLARDDAKKIKVFNELCKRLYNRDRQSSAAPSADSSCSLYNIDLSVCLGPIWKPYP